MNRTHVSITPWSRVSFHSRSQNCQRLLTRSIHSCVARGHSKTTQQVLMEFDTGGNVTKNTRGIPNSISLKWFTIKRSCSGLRHYPSIRLEGVNKQEPFSTVGILTACLQSICEIQLTFLPHCMYSNIKSSHIQKDKFQEKSSSRTTITIHTNSHR
jgi:hypothetical protein